jgi:hypothetical protein
MIVVVGSGFYCFIALLLYCFSAFGFAGKKRKRRRKFQSRGLILDS